MSSSGSSGAVPYSRLLAGQNIAFGGIFGSANNIQGQGSLWVYPVRIGQPLTLTKLGVAVTVAGDAGSTLTPAVYADSNCAPGALVLAGAPVAGDAVGNNLGNAAGTLTPGWYWVGALPLGIATTVPTCRIITSETGWPAGSGVFRWDGAPTAPFYAHGGLAAVPNPFNGATAVGQAIQLIGAT